MKKSLTTQKELSQEVFGQEGISFFHNTMVQFVLAWQILLLLGSFIVLGYFVRAQQSVVIIHYNVYFGIDLIGVWWQIFIIPTIGLLFTLINTTLAYFLYEHKERIAAYTLLLTSLFLGLGVLLSCGSIAFINY
jgi:hypothetical protein